MLECMVDTILLLVDPITLPYDFESKMSWLVLFWLWTLLICMQAEWCYSTQASAESSKLTDL